VAAALLQRIPAYGTKVLASIVAIASISRRRKKFGPFADTWFGRSIARSSSK
jgi:hypothetical protein